MEWLARVFRTLFPIVTSIFIARKIFHFSRPETLGRVAGARNGITSIGAIQDDLESAAPALGILGHLLWPILRSSFAACLSLA